MCWRLINAQRFQPSRQKRAQRSNTETQHELLKFRTLGHWKHLCAPLFKVQVYTYFSFCNHRYWLNTESNYTHLIFYQELGNLSEDGFINHYYLNVKKFAHYWEVSNLNWVTHSITIHNDLFTFPIFFQENFWLLFLPTYIFSVRT